MDKKSLFNKIFANLPIATRNEIIVVIDDQPFTWNSLRIEVINDTELAKRALDVLESIGILKELPNA